MRPAPSGGWRHGFRVAPHPRFSNVFTGSSCFTNPSYAGSFFCRQFYPRRRFSYGLPFMPYFWGSPEDYQPAEEPTAPAPEQDSALASQVESLADEVESLREEQASRNDMRPRPVAPRPAVQEKPAATILVYRDGHQGEVQNYAILGKTLWVFAEQTTRRVSLADLDLPATKRLNDERGVDFFSPDLP